MAIHRPQEPTRDFTKSARFWVRDPALSAKAKGLLTYITSHSPTYELSMEQIVAEMRDDERSVRSGIKELEKLGYLRRWRRRDQSGKLGGYDWQVIDFPEKFAAQHQADETQSGSEQEERGEGAGQDHTAKKPGGVEQGKQGVSAGQNHTAKEQPGSEQGEQGVSAGGGHTAKRRTKESKETMEGDKEKTMERSGMECSPFGRFAPSGAGDDEHNSQPLILEATEPSTSGWSDWRAEDYRRFLNALGTDKVYSSGGKAGPAGHHTAHALYTGMQRMPDGKKEWPGRYLEAMQERGGDEAVDEWLARYDLERA